MTQAELDDINTRVDNIITKLEAFKSTTAEVEFGELQNPAINSDSIAINLDDGGIEEYLDTITEVRYDVEDILDQLNSHL